MHFFTRGHFSPSSFCIYKTLSHCIKSRLSSSLRHFHRKDEAVFVKFETVNADYAVVSVSRTERMAVVDDVEIIAAPHDAVMSSVV